MRFIPAVSRVRIPLSLWWNASEKSGAFCFTSSQAKGAASMARWTVTQNKNFKITVDKCCIVLYTNKVGCRWCACSINYGVLAQLGEHLPYKQRVIGSSPIGPIYICGEIAQLARACGSYPQCRGFESPSRYDWNASEKSGAFCFTGS